MQRRTPLPSQEQAIVQTLVRAEQTGTGYAEALLEMANRTSARYDAQGRRVKPTRKFGRRPRPPAPPHPNSLLALEMHRWETTFGGPRAPYIRKCCHVRRNGTRCKAAAVRDTVRCPKHGGLIVRERRWRLRYADYRYVRSRIAVSILRALQSLGRIPLELLRLDPFPEVLTRAMHGVNSRDVRFQHWTYAQRRLHQELCCDLALGYVVAYEGITQRGDWSKWTEVVREAAKHGPWPTKAEAAGWLKNPN